MAPIKAEVNFEEFEKYVMCVTRRNLRTWDPALSCRGERYRLPRIPVILAGTIPTALRHSSYWPHFLIEGIGLEKVKAMPWGQIKFQGRRPGLVSLLELSL